MLITYPNRRFDGHSLHTATRIFQRYNLSIDGSVRRVFTPTLLTLGVISWRNRSGARRGSTSLHHPLSHRFKDCQSLPAVTPSLPLATRSAFTLRLISISKTFPGSTLESSLWKRAEPGGSTFLALALRQPTHKDFNAAAQVAQCLSSADSNRVPCTYSHLPSMTAAISP